MSLSLPVQHRILSSLERSPARWALGIIFVSLVVRLMFVVSGQLDLVQDEAQYWDWSRRLQFSYYSKGPLIAWFIAFWTGIFGDTEFGVRIGAMLNATLVQGLLYYFLAGMLKRPRLGVLTLIVANSMPLFLAGGILMTTDNILMVCWLGALICLYAATNEKTRGWSIAGLILCMAFGNLAKYMMLAFFGVAVVYLWLLHRHRLTNFRTNFAVLSAMAAGSLLGYIPILVWNIQNGWAGFLHVGSLAGVTGSKAVSLFKLEAVPEFLAGQLGVATPWWLILALFAGYRAFHAAWRGHANYEDPLREKSVFEQVRQSALLTAGFWPIWLAMFLWSFHTDIYANWPGMSYVAGAILAASGLERLLAGYGKTRNRKYAPAWLAISAFIFVLVFASPLLPLPSALNPANRLKGWADMGQHAASVAETLPNPDKVFYFSDNYGTTAELAFYVPGQPMAYCAALGRRFNQYDFWPGPLDEDSPGGNKKGWDAIYVTTSKLPPLLILNMFESLEIIRFQSTHKGHDARKFLIVVARNFNGSWPKLTYEKY